MHVWTQLTYLALTCAALGVSIAKYGETKVSKYDWSDFVSVGLILTLLYCGGFFAPLGI
jgi:hypothetical protein